MSNKQVVVVRAGMGFIPALLLAFIVLKITGHIDSWLWALSPLWVPTALFTGFLVTAAICAVVVSAFRK